MESEKESIDHSVGGDDQGDIFIAPTDDLEHIFSKSRKMSLDGAFDAGSVDFEDMDEDEDEDDGLDERAERIKEREWRLELQKAKGRDIAAEIEEEAIDEGDAMFEAERDAAMSRYTDDSAKARKAHNKWLRKHKKELEPLRQKFIRRHFAEFRPFLTHKVCMPLRACVCV